MKKNSLLLKAFAGTNDRVPVWFMRQAGRYLPEYQKIKSKYSLQAMFNTPELAAEITCQPIDRLGVDAAILFADILTLPAAMGFKIGFDDRKGPVIDTNFNVEKIHDFDNLENVATTIKQVNTKLPGHIPLIGFAGSPFTVLAFLIEGGSSVNYKKLFKFIYSQTKIFHRLMSILTDNTIRYLKLQVQAGVDVIQLFDTCAGILRPADYARFVLPYVRKIFIEIDVPSIYFLKNTEHLLGLMDQTQADFLSVDHTVVLGHQNVTEKTKKGIQGNLFNGNLYLDYPELEKEIKDVLIGGSRHGRYIFNLSHGVFPDIDADKLKFIVDQVHEFQWSQV